MMIDRPEARTPLFPRVWKEQVRIVGLSIRREALAAAALLGLSCLAMVVVFKVPAISALAEGLPTTPRLDPAVPPFALFATFSALILPLLVWKGERPTGGTPIWSLPVDHRRHALTKMAAGWIWLMVILGVGLLFTVLTALAVGGSLGADEIRLLITPGAELATQEVAWTTPWWEWALPFTAATAAYLLVSALLLATAHPYLWTVAIWVLGGVVVGATEYFEVESLARGIDLVNWYVGADPFVRGIQLSTGEWGTGWRRLPSMGMWAASSAFWIGLGLVSVLMASMRARDR